MGDVTVGPTKNRHCYALSRWESKRLHISLCPRWAIHRLEESTMPQSLSNILIHLIWSTKDRQPWLQPGIREKTHAFLAGAVRKCNCEAYRVGGVADHVHLAIRLSRTLSVSHVVKEIKTSSSKWAKIQEVSLLDFAWQQGYGAFSLGMSQKEALLHYIDTQEEHHRTCTFQDEYRAFLTKYGIEYDERYVWD
jgi:putative transposase